jgi:hypothetical protein
MLPANIQSSSRAREASLSDFPTRTASRLWIIASGLVVSRGSPGIAVFNSVRSSREVVSPSEHIASPAGRTIEQPKQQVSRHVVAPDDRGGTKIIHRHETSVDMFLGDRSIVEQIGARERNSPVETHLPLIHQCQDGSGGHELVRAAHREALISAITNPAARDGVERDNAQPPPCFASSAARALSACVTSVSGADGEACARRGRARQNMAPIPTVTGERRVNIRCIRSP